ncbi:Uncharacterised protein (plasmid) [Tsukamurella tyrosinosolvens]|uniref:Uncharacterized protein n=1 Tax=Tsukamurella tyrosinosolvens TaxID=57704 RepID=A0A1H4UYE7_TSUTY|nr:hypothetical protein AXK58_21985 [Tsukamurella tyrosinosolvens]SEC73787.1 hypothetical protein SAMN04489793_3081 [Tsukamurella tyrosinosolvens]VEH90799.1 Uncharacterised protein [Tsukamurella tyrosinosolvens]
MASPFVFVWHVVPNDPTGGIEDELIAYPADDVTAALSRTWLARRGIPFSARPLGRFSRSEYAAARAEFEGG